MMMLLTAAFAIECTQGPTTTATVQRSIDAAEIAFVDMDDAGLDRHRNEALAAVTCLGELIHPTHAGALLRLEGSYAFVRGNPDAAISAFRSALTIQPDFRLNAAMAPPGGPLHGAYETARLSPAEFWPIPPPATQVFVNGVANNIAPAGLTVVQYVDGQGSIAFSGIVGGPGGLPPQPAVAAVPMPGPQPLPDPLVPPPLPVPGPTPLPDPVVSTPKRKSAKVPLLATSGVTAVAAAGLFAGSAVMRGRYDAGPTAQRRQLTNTLYTASAGAGIVTVGLLTAAIVVPGKHKSTEEDGLY